MMCSLETCDRPRASKGFCDTHYRRWRRDGDPHESVPVIVRQSRVGSCSIEGCGGSIQAVRLCNRHHQRLVKYGDPLGGGPMLPPLELTETGRRCRKCRRDLPPEAFHKADHATKHVCRECEDLTKLSKKYGIPPDEYWKMFNSQGGLCAICGQPPGGDGRFKRLSVDHDHGCCPGAESCGTCVRGLLCRPCNFGLGGFRDRVELLHAAEAYLKRTTD